MDKINNILKNKTSRGGKRKKEVLQMRVWDVKLNPLWMLLK